MSAPAIVRSPSWRWIVCGLLLLATMINYMDRLTLNLLATDINKTLGLDKSDYASIESGFALAFAAGSILFGFLVDRWNVFWVYPLAVLAWSAAGFFTGFADGFVSLLLCRVLLGLAEAANWPCALKTTQHILPPGERAMGNSILQSGAAVGAIVIPLVLLLLFDESRPQTWRMPFFVVGGVGALWVVLWWSFLRPADLHIDHAAPATAAGGPAVAPLSAGLVARRFAALVVLVVTINMTWHFLRAWGPLFLREQHQFTQQQTSWFFSAYYLFTDVGALSAGFATLWLARHGTAVHASRRLVYLGCALLCLLCLAVPYLASPALLVAALLVIGFGALGLFPNYYSFTQDLSRRHQGKVTGVLSCLCWLAMAIWQKGIGWIVEATGSYTIPFWISGVAPLLAFVALQLLWGQVEDPAARTPVGSDDEATAKPGSTAIQAPGSVVPG